MIRPRWVRICLLVQIALAVIHALGVAGLWVSLGFGWRPGGWSESAPMLFLAIPVLVARAARVRDDRTAWILLAVGWSAYCLGVLLWQLLYVGMDSPPFPSPADALWLTFYPCALVAVVLLLRARLPRVTRPMLLDGAVTTLAAGAFGIAVVLPIVTELFGGSVAQNATLLAYPVGDVSVLALLAGGIAVCGLRGGRLLCQLGIGMLAMLVADTGYLLLTAQGNWAGGGPFDLGWPLLAMMLAWSAWSAPSALRAPSTSRRRAGTIPLVFGMSAAALIVAAAFVPISPVAVCIAVFAVSLLAGRGYMAMREAAELEEVRVRTLTDDLTGLANRRGLGAAVERAAYGNEPTTESWSLALLGLDAFKEMNKTLGPQAGDVLLAEVARRLGDLSFPGATVARVGGDEFAVFVPQAETAAARLAAALSAMLEEPVIVDGMAVRLQASVGIAFAADVHGFAELFRRAEVAMYRSKTEDTVWSVYSTDAEQDDREELELVAELRRALQPGDEQIVAWYQPQFDMATGKLIAAETLARWEHPTRGLLGPYEFVALAANHGLMKPLTRHMIDRAVADCAQWSTRGLTIGVSVNVSAANLVDAALATDVAAALERHDLPPARLTLEVTEADIMTDYERTSATLEGLRTLGVVLSIDDFGTGHSSLARLRSLPAGEIKIDRSFVTSMTTQQHDKAIVIAVLELARRFGKRVVAEGVEDEGTWAELRELGCDVAQGFLMGRPQPAGELVAHGDHVTSPRPAPTTPERLSANLALAPIAKDACSVVARYLTGRGFGLSSVYLRRGQRLRCQAMYGYWQVLDGLPLGAGVIGQCLVQNRTLNLDLAEESDHYLEAASGVRYELAVPARCAGEAVAVVNVEAVESFTAAEVAVVEEAAAMLGRRLEALGTTNVETPTQQLSRLADQFSDAQTSADVEHHLVQAAVELTGMESAFVASRGGSGDWGRLAVGPLAETFATLGQAQLTELTQHVGHGASLIAAGDADGSGLALLDDLRRSGATTLVLVALRHRGQSEGLLVVADRSPEPPATERLELLELLGAQASSALQTLATLGRLRHEATHDPLTGLGHRGAFRAGLERAIRDADGGQTLAVALIDLDHFKIVNDTSGHLAGDRLLRAVAGRLTDRVRSDDGVFRLGGDEFAVLFTSATGVDLEAAAVRLHEAIASTGEITASVGVTAWRPEDTTDGLLARADEALYAAKHAGRDAVRLA